MGMKKITQTLATMRADPAFKDRANVGDNLATLLRANIASRKAPAPMREAGRLKTKPGLAVMERRRLGAGRH